MLLSALSNDKVGSMISMTSKRRFVALLFLALTTTSISSLALASALDEVRPKAPQSQQGFDLWADNFAVDWVRLSAEMATDTQYFSGAEQDVQDRQLTPITPAQRAKEIALARIGLARLNQFLAGPLETTQRSSAETMRNGLQHRIAGEPYADHNFVFSQFSGAHINAVRFMTTAHPLRNAADVSSYLARLSQIADRMDEAIATGRAATERSLIPPRVILERAQTQVQTFLAPPAQKNVLVTTFAQRIERISGLSAAERATAIASATRIVEQQIRPAYARIQTFMTEIYPRTGDAVGLSRLPDGAQAYQVALAKFTGTVLSAGDIHAIGLREVARIEARMDGLLRQLGFQEGSIAQRMALLEASLQPVAGSDPRPDLLMRYTAMVRDAEKRSTALFNLKPRAPVEVLREPALTEASAAAHYNIPAPDGSRPGVFWVPLPGPLFNMSRMRSLSYHEAVPGHHFQLAIQAELTGLPKFRTMRIFGGGSAHSEGWALYTEKLAVEQDWYRDDAVGLLGALGSELFRARRLVVDTGLHSKGWTREQAIEYGIEASEVERYIAWPGQACAYMLGMLRIVELRERAKTALGTKFSLPAFHDVVLQTGSVPMDVLEKIVDQWIAGQKSA